MITEQGMRKVYCGKLRKPDGNPWSVLEVSHLCSYMTHNYRVEPFHIAVLTTHTQVTSDSLGGLVGFKKCI